jgi:V/A-type H+-transporting ATPase subunit E
MKPEKSHIASSGVEKLIERLREEAVNAGQAKAEDIVVNAQKRAEWIIEEAELEAKQLLEKARAEAESIKSAGLDALQLAGRDALLKLRDTLLGSFSQEVMRVVGKQMAKEDFIEQLILALAGRVREKTGLDSNREIIIQLPEDAIGTDELRKNPEELNQGALSHLTAAIASDLLREGVKFDVSDEIRGGLIVKLVDNNMTIDFSDEAVATLFLEHLQPRFRALLQGIVK